MPALTDLVAVVAWVAAVLLVVAGVAKLRRPGGTVTALAAARLPVGARTVRVVGVAEVATGVAVLAFGGRAATVVAAALYAGFTAFVVRQRRAGGASCGCFGEERTPVTGVHVALNAVAALGCAGAAVTASEAPWAALAGAGATAGAATVVLVVLGAWLGRLALTVGADLAAATALHPRPEVTR